MMRERVRLMLGLAAVVMLTFAPRAAVAAGTGVVQTGRGDAADRAARVLAAAREALGGDARLAGVKSFDATGRTRQVRGENLVPIEFQVFCELPAKYVRVDEIPAQETGLTASGFNGDALLQDPAPATPPADAARKTRIAALKQDVARLGLALFAASFSDNPLTFAYAGQAEAPEGRADVIDVKGSGIPMRLFISSDTHLPLMISWMAPARNPQAAPVETRLYYAEYRDVNGVRWPFRIRQSVGGATVEETTFDRYRINPKIDPKRFASGR